MKTLTLFCCVLVFALDAPRPLLAHADIGGEWAIEFSGGDVQSEADMRMFVKQDDSRLTGYVDWNASPDTFPLKGTISDDRFIIAWSSRVNALVTEITFKGTVNGDEFTGTVDIPGRPSGELSGRRVGR